MPIDGILKMVVDNGGTLTNGVLAVLLLWWAWSVYSKLVAGKLVPQQVHDDVRVERDLWRQTAQENARQKKELIESLEVTQALLRVVQKTLADEEVQP